MPNHSSISDRSNVAEQPIVSTMREVICCGQRRYRTRASGRFATGVYLTILATSSQSQFDPYSCLKKTSSDSNALRLKVMDGIRNSQVNIVLAATSSGAKKGVVAPSSL